MTKYTIKDNLVIGGDKVVTPFGELAFQRTFVTYDSAIANYFRNKEGYTVTETEEE